ncbi:MAG: LysR family transcriptional regulator [Hyphomicrobiaceae bacterium]
MLYNLRVLSSVAQHNGFAAAARKLGVSTSTIMRAMDALEDFVGTTLLSRTTRRVELTEAGLRLLSGGSPLADELEALVRDVRETENELTGNLRVTSALSFGRSVLIPLVGAFLEDNPEVSVDLTLTDSVVDLDENNIDVAIRIADPNRAPELIVHELSAMRRHLCASPAYIERRGRPRKPEDLPRHDCLLFRPTLQRDVWVTASDVWTFAKLAQPDRSVEVKGKISSNDADALVAAARDGHGVVAMPDWLVAPEISQGRLNRLLGGFELLCPEPKSLHLAYPQHRRRSRKVQAFVAAVREGFANRATL